MIKALTGGRHQVAGPHHAGRQLRQYGRFESRNGVEARMLVQLEEARRVLEGQGKNLDIRSLEAGASKIRELERGLKKELKRLKKAHQARLDALRQLKGVPAVAAEVKKAAKASGEERPVSYDD